MRYICNTHRTESLIQYIFKNNNNNKYYYYYCCYDNRYYHYHQQHHQHHHCIPRACWGPMLPSGSSILLCRSHMLIHFSTCGDSLLMSVIRSHQHVLLRSQNRPLVREPGEGTGESYKLLLPAPELLYCRVGYLMTTLELLRATVTILDITFCSRCPILQQQLQPGSEER